MVIMLVNVTGSPIAIVILVKIVVIVLTFSKSGWRITSTTGAREITAAASINPTMKMSIMLFTNRSGNLRKTSLMNKRILIEPIKGKDLVQGREFLRHKLEMDPDFDASLFSVSKQLL